MKYFEKPCNNYVNEQYDREQRAREIEEETERLYSDPV